MENISTERPPMPSTYMAVAILTTLFCCLPFGIVSIVKASQVSSFYSQGSYPEAERASKSARTWALVGAISGVAVYVLWALFAFVLPLLF